MLCLLLFMLAYASNGQQLTTLLTNMYNSSFSSAL